MVQRQVGRVNWVFFVKLEKKGKEMIMAGIAFWPAELSLIDQPEPSRKRDLETIHKKRIKAGAIGPYNRV